MHNAIPRNGYKERPVARVYILHLGETKKTYFERNRKNSL